MLTARSRYFKNISKNFLKFFLKRLDTGRRRQQSNGHSITSSSITTSPSMDGSWPTTIEGLTVGIKGMRASSVPAKRRIMTVN